MNDVKNLESGIDAFNEGDYAAAVSLLEVAYSNLKDSNKTKELGFCLYYLENSKAFLNDDFPQKDPIEKAYAIFCEYDLDYLAASCCKLLAEITSGTDYQQAIHFLDTAKEHYKHCENWTGTASVARLKAKLALGQHAKEQALVWIDEALDLIDKQPQGLGAVKAEQREIKKLKAVIEVS